MIKSSRIKRKTAAAMVLSQFIAVPVCAQALPPATPLRPAALGVETQAQRREADERRSPVALPSLGSRTQPGDRTPLFRLKKIELQGATALPASELAASYRPYLDRELSAQDLAAIAAAITARYREAGFHLSRALIPPQDMSSGTLKVTVVEGVIEQVSVSGADATFGLQRLLAPLTEERPSSFASMERQLLLINERPGIKVVDTTLDETSPGSGRFHLGVKTKSWRLYGATAIDNMGSSSSGPWQASGSVAINSMLIPGDSLTVSGSFVPGSPREMRYGRIAYDLPLGSDSWRIGVAASHSENWPGDLRRYLRNRSQTDTVEARISYAPILSQMQSLWLTASLGVTRASERDFIGPVFADRIGIASFTADYKLHLRPSSWTYVSATARKGLGLIDGQPDSADWLSRHDASPYFALINGSLTHYENVSENWSIKLAAVGQLASGPLLASQQYALGGLSFGRGFDAGWISGDDAIAGSAELRYDQSLSLKFLKGYQLFTFIEGGAARTKLAGHDLDQSFASVGAGVRLFLTEDLHLSVGIAKPVMVNSPFEPKKNARLLFSLSNIFRL
nr:POTRA domain-containing protein [Methylobacterium sp. ZNC0032]